MFCVFAEEDTPDPRQSEDAELRKELTASDNACSELRVLYRRKERALSEAIDRSEQDALRVLQLTELCSQQVCFLLIDSVFFQW